MTIAPATTSRATNHKDADPAPRLIPNEANAITSSYRRGYAQGRHQARELLELGVPVDTFERGRLRGCVTPFGHGLYAGMIAHVFGVSLWR